jgi:UDP-2,3-diacylglucosamine hydrolase
MSRTLFISDLHLSSDQPQVSAQLFRFLAGTARGADALYILGDLFEVWLGDDALDAPDGERLPREVADALHALQQAGTAVLLMHGNRDFLLGAGFAQACGARLIDDPTRLTLCGQAVALMHGDTLCTDDVAYQKFRAKSEQAKRATPDEIMDVTPSAVQDAFRRLAVTRLIHGHTHRPATHRYEIDGQHCERWVLPDWDRGCGYLVAEDGALRLERV